MCSAGHHSGAAEGIFGFGDHAGLHAGHAEGGKTEGIIGLKFTDTTGMLHRLFMTLKPSAPSRNRRMGQGVIRVLTNERVESRHGLFELAVFFQFFRGRVGLFTTSHHSVLSVGVSSSPGPHLSTALGQGF